MSAATTAISLDIGRAKWSEQCLREFLPHAPSHIVSDIGTGYGWAKDTTESLGGSWQGFDQTLKAPGIRSWNLNEPAPADAEQPGIVLLLEVLEHLWNPEVALRHITEHLLPGGYLVMTAPNPGWSRSRVYALNHGVPYSFTRRHLPEHHVFTTWPHIVEMLLESLGLEVQTCVTLSPDVGTSGSAGALDRVKTMTIVGLCKLIEMTDRSARGSTLGIVARKATPAASRNGAL